ncbi:hypothetical protein NKI12_28570 [Mesorhizobium australicum]|uniref:Uncharacterized protein n=1 Tax=Mesorhizobium australicum TaxID=536018 RepID=A0ACC6T7B1_9HYPH
MHVEKEMEVIGVQREARYMGGAVVTFRADKRQALWGRVQGKIGSRHHRRSWENKRPLLPSFSGNYQLDRVIMAPPQMGMRGRRPRTRPVGA